MIWQQPMLDMLLATSGIGIAFAGQVSACIHMRRLRKKWVFDRLRTWQDTLGFSYVFGPFGFHSPFCQTLKYCGIRWNMTRKEEWLAVFLRIRPKRLRNLKGLLATGQQNQDTCAHSRTVFKKPLLPQGDRKKAFSPWLDCSEACAWKMAPSRDGIHGKWDL
jgi:hypothetical protein